MTRLFDQPSATKMNALKASALKEVDEFPRGIFSNPALGVRLADLVKRYALDIATIKPNGISKKREKQLTVNILPKFEVTILFNGDVDSLRLRPSNFVAIETECHFITNGISFTLDDNDQTDQAIDHFVALVNNNLDVLRKDWSVWPAKISEEVKRVADLRADQVRGQQERDAKSKYPIQKDY